LELSSIFRNGAPQAQQKRHLKTARFAWYNFGLDSNYPAGDVCPIERDNAMKNRILLVVLSLAAASAAGCIGFERKSTLAGPSTAGIGALMGNWSSANVIPSASTCTDFKWNVTEQTASSAKGSFSATCANDLKFNGSAQGNLTSAGTIAWSAQATASAPGLPSCGVALTGTAELTTDSVRVPYSGDTCLGKVSGTEILKRN
jgi:hypothetical protein